MYGKIEKEEEREKKRRKKERRKKEEIKFIRTGERRKEME